MIKLYILNIQTIVNIFINSIYLNRTSDTPPPTPSRTKAFTLIEVLVVLIIIAIITAVSVLAFGQFGRTRRERMIVQQFVRTIAVAEQQAILTPSVLGLGIGVAGYQFYQYELPQAGKPGVWHALERDALSRPHVFKSVFHATVKSIATYAAAQNNKGTPEILFLPSGYVTPFVLELAGSTHDFMITVSNNGTVTVQTLLEKNHPHET